MTIEYIIKKKTEGTQLIKKIAVVSAYIILYGMLAIVIINLSAPLFIMPFLLIDLLFCSMIAFVTWRFVCIEYELIIGAGEINATVIYGKSVRKRLLSVPLNSLIEIGTYDDAAYEKLCRSSLRKNYICVSSMSAPEIYYALFDIEKERCVLYFEADDKALRYLKQQSPSAFRAGNIK